MSTTERHLNPAETRRLVDMLGKAADKLSGRTIKIMEVCGTHTATAHQEGLHAVLPGNIRLISGPGCPVCVTPGGYIDQAAQLALEENAHITTYGDMVRVPGITISMAEARSKGAAVSVVYTVQDALEMARKNPGQKIVFLGIGFETTTPPSAYAIKTARQEKLDNFLVFSAHKRIIPAMQALLEDPELAIDGFIAPGHVSVIIGSDCYALVSQKYKRPCVVAGFDGQQMLMAMVAILMQLVDREARVENVYGTRVKGEGNIAALEIIDEVFDIADSRWRGLGTIPKSGLELKEEFAAFDARRVFGLAEPEDREPSGCRCGDVIKGIITPLECPLFARRCKPSEPVGACMVSREGSCSVYYQYRKHAKPLSSKG
ncbi:MAG: hydrogenase formation protein HypD [Sedimentisphaerales bacterium]|nr:hydrogenase formation protein HypD [Sedimentisphaerales bacterium]